MKAHDMPDKIVLVYYVIIATEVVLVAQDGHFFMYEHSY